jgi:hypothetical protein
MSKGLLAVLATIVVITGPVFAQQAGGIICGFDVGLASATDDFADNPDLQAGSGLCLGAEMRYTLFNNFSLGPFIRYYRFGTSLTVDIGSASHNMTQYGGLARCNLFNVEKGKLFLFGGGGLFEPNTHYWAPDYSYDEPFERGQFFTGGFGLCSDPYASAIYEIEFRYNMGDADLETIDDDRLVITNYDFSSFHVSMKLMFNSKGYSKPPRY